MSVSTIIAIVAGVVALAALAGSWMLSRRIKAAESRATELARLASAGDIQGIARQVDARLSALEEANECRKADDAALADRLGRAVRHVGLVRFDAFDNTAGAQSFSLALLDDAGDCPDEESKSIDVEDAIALILSSGEQERRHVLKCLGAMDDVEQSLREGKEGEAFLKMIGAM